MTPHQTSEENKVCSQDARYLQQVDKHRTHVKVCCYQTEILAHQGVLKTLLYVNYFFLIKDFLFLGGHKPKRCHCKYKESSAIYQEMIPSKLIIISTYYNSSPFSEIMNISATAFTIIPKFYSSQYTLCVLWDGTESAAGC